MNVDFYYDFGSPNAYLAHCVIPGIEARTGARFTYKPCLLGGVFKSTGNQSPMFAYQNVKGKLAYERLELQRFVVNHDLSAFRFNPHFPVNTLLMMRGAMAAELDGVHDAYVAACMVAMWEDGHDMSKPEIFTQVMNDAGLDGAALLARTGEDEIKTRLMEKTAQAVERGIFGMPSFFVGDEMFFGKERLGQVEDEIRKQMA